MDWFLSHSDNFICISIIVCCFGGFIEAIFNDLDLYTDRWPGLIKSVTQSWGPDKSHWYFFITFCSRQCLQDFNIYASSSSSCVISHCHYPSPTNTSVCWFLTKCFTAIALRFTAEIETFCMHDVYVSSFYLRYRSLAAYVPCTVFSLEYP